MISKFTQIILKRGCGTKIYVNSSWKIGNINKNGYLC